jgi:hypothetical protein
LSENAGSPPPASRSPILSEAEADRRLLLLAELQAALAGLGVGCVLARNHRLVLRYNQGPCEPSGLTDPKLHVFLPDGTGIATTDGTDYRLADGGRYPASDPVAAAAVIVGGHRIASRT